jgi:hypothetical protein
MDITASQYYLLSWDINSLYEDDYMSYSYLVDSLQYLPYLISSKYAIPNNTYKGFLEKSINDMYRERIFSNYNLEESTRSLQTYIFNKYGEINNYLYANNIQVGSYFAILSSKIGFDIEAYNIL